MEINEDNFARPRCLYSHSQYCSEGKAKSNCLLASGQNCTPIHFMVETPEIGIESDIKLLKDTVIIYLNIYHID